MNMPKEQKSIDRVEAVESSISIHKIKNQFNILAEEGGIW